jgi:SAM-dependent methyltransferase
MSNIIEELNAIVRNQPPGTEGDEKIQKFLLLIPKKLKRVLVIGCGDGYEVDWLNKNGFEATGVTINKNEASRAMKRYGVKIIVAEMHNIPTRQKYDAIYASNILEHSVAPFLALKHWWKLLKTGGELVLVMPSKHWQSVYYHYSVLTHSQTKDLLLKAGFELLAGPQIKPKILLPKDSDIFHDLGRLWGHLDGYIARKTVKKAPRFDFESPEKYEVKGNILRNVLKVPYNYVRVWLARRERD